MNATRYPLLANPHIRLSGPVDQLMYTNFRQQLENCPREGAIVIALTTLGGDPEVARTMADDIRLLEDHDGREILFLGKVAVYSAGATFMAAFPVGRRFLTRHTRLMIHERTISKCSVAASRIGPSSSSRRDSTAAPMASSSAEPQITICSLAARNRSPSSASRVTIHP